MDNDHAELGYVFHAFPSGASLGYAELEVFLVAAGTNEGFAPAQLTLFAWGQDGGGLSKLALTVQWAGPETIHVAPGIITILSYGGGEQTAYCFGGVLTCRHDKGCLHCRLTSSAPILNVGEEGMDWSENVVLRVVDGIESEIAAYRARVNDQDETVFNERLAHTDPRLLYAVGLIWAQHSQAMLPESLRTEHYWDEHNVLTRALHAAQDSAWWPREPTLAAVLPAQGH